MKKERRKFRMKRFEVGDSRCGCRIGVDATMIGSWVPVEKWMHRIMDAGCGCGIIAMMVAQRALDLVGCRDGKTDASRVADDGDGISVVGVDVDEGAIADARENVALSPFAGIIEIRRSPVDALIGKDDRFDLIVSNPPYFESGGDPDLSSRMLARHAGTLSPELLMRMAAELLNDGGALGFIGPAEYIRKYLQFARDNGLTPERICMIKGHPGASCKRVMIYLRYHSEGPASSGCEKGCRIEHLNIKDAVGEFTPEYMELGRDFYLRF